jgi:hypothetical protein
MYFVLLSFIPNPMLTEAPLFRVTTSTSVAVTNRPVSTHHLRVLLKTVPFGLVSVSLITFSSTILNNVADSATLCFKPLSVPNA